MTRPRPIPGTRRRLFPLLALLLLPAACAGTARDSARTRSEVTELVRRERFAEALARAEEARDRRPDDPEAEALYRDAAVAWLLARGREESFEDRDAEALAYFERARELDPDSPVARQWMDKTRLKLADRWLLVALGLHAGGDLDGAIAAYDRALDLVPGHQSALNGREEARIVRDHRVDKGQRYYDRGVRALSDYWLEQARWNFMATGKYLPEDERTGARRSLTEEMLADQRMVLAENLEQDGHYAAALREYGQVLALDPQSAEARAGRERMVPESEAARLLHEAGFLIMRERYDQALERLDRAEGLTVQQLDAVDGLRREVATQRLETLYERALSLEKDQRYPEAIVAYDALLEQADYFRDAQTRRGTLEEYVRLAGEFYAAAAAESDPQKRLEHLWAILGFWNEYRDVERQARALEAELGLDDAPDEAESSDAGPTEPE